MDRYDRLTALAKRRGIFYPSYEIYGGVSGFFDFGPLGTRLKQNLEEQWRRTYVLGEGFAEIEAPTVSPEGVFRASGHLAAFADVEVTCAACGKAFRGDHLIEDVAGRVLDALGELDDPPAALVELVQGKVDAVAEQPDVETVAMALTMGWRDGESVVDEEGATFVLGDFEAAFSCPECGQRKWARPERFNLMFKTHVGAGTAQTGYLRPETAQGMFVAFRDLHRFARERLPFGVVQLGRAYRNEISPRQGMLRLREFSQMEAEVFVDPDDKTHPRFPEVADATLSLVPAEGDPVEVTAREAVDKGIVLHEMLAYFLVRTQQYLVEVGVDRDRLRFRQHLSTEMAHYSRDTWDCEAKAERFGWVEVVGIADRTCYDLESHMEESGIDLVHNRPLDEPVERTVRRVVPDMGKLGPAFKGAARDVGEALEALDPDAAGVEEGGDLEVEVAGETVTVPGDAFTVEETVERVTVEPLIPHVIEPSYGVDRIFYLVLDHAYEPEAARGWDVLHLDPRVAPVKAGVFPLMTKDGLDDRAREVDRRLREGAGLHTYYDDSGNIGRRYARQDEVGTPYCVTVDYEALEGEGVTLRDRETTEQVRVPEEDLVEVLEGLVDGDLAWADVAGRYPAVEAGAGEEE